MNEYIAWVQSDPGAARSRTQNDEQAMINVLAGLGGLIEYNVRAGYQHFARKQQLKADKFHSYSDLLDALESHIKKDSLKKLLKVSSQIRNKLMHADFPALYAKTKEAYQIPGVEFQQSLFEPAVRTFITTITRYGLNLDAQTGLATDSRGEPIPSKELLPGAGGAITVDFRYFYDSGHFVHVYDVLRTAYQSIVSFRYEHV